MKGVSDISEARMKVPGGMGGAIDLQAVKDKKNFQHRWSMLARFGVPSQMVNQLKADTVDFDSKMERRIRSAREQALSQGIDPDDETADVQVDISGLAEPSFPFVYGPGNNLTMEGPGCIKCATLWRDEVKGVGHLCTVSDVDFVKQPGGIAVLAIYAEREKVWAATATKMLADIKAAERAALEEAGIDPDADTDTEPETVPVRELHSPVGALSTDSADPAAAALGMLTVDEALAEEAAEELFGHDGS
jgi:hypothetical protein